LSWTREGGEKEAEANENKRNQEVKQEKETKGTMLMRG